VFLHEKKIKSVVSANHFEYNAVVINHRRKEMNFKKFGMSALALAMLA
jgi:hypothetical protein